MLRSGIAALDERLGGLVEGRTYVLSGGPGTGKSVACMEFVAAGLEEDTPAVVLTHDDPGDLLAQSEFLGHDLGPALREERLILLRYQLDFARRFMRSASTDLPFEELYRLMGSRAPSRLVIDSVAPFLEASTASGGGIQSLTHFLQTLGSTAMVTLPGDPFASYDRRLEPLVQRAAAIFHFTMDRERTPRLEIRKVRYQVPSTAPILFRVQPGAGIVPLSSERRRYEDVPEDTKRRVLVLNLSGTFPEEMLRALRTRYDVAVRSDVASAFGDLAGAHPGLVLIDVRRDTLDQSLSLIRQLRRAASRAPAVLITSFQLRSNDRARALRAGADEFIPCDTLPDEVLHRVESVIQRGHVPIDEEDREVPLLVQPGADAGQAEPFAEGDFIDAVRTHIEKDRLPFFTLVTLRPARGEPRQLADLAVRSMRVDGGDLSGIADDEVFVYLHSVRRKDVDPFIERVRDEWRRAGHGELDVETASYPSDEDRIRSLVETSPGAGA